jgi:hypothetical protein
MRIGLHGVPVPVVQRKSKLECVDKLQLDFEHHISWESGQLF